MSHIFAITFQQAQWILEFGATEESDIDMGFEHVDIGKGGICDTRGRVAVMEQFTYIISTIAHYLEPMPSDRAQFARMFVHPGSD